MWTWRTKEKQPTCPGLAELRAEAWSAQGAGKGEGERLERVGGEAEGGVGAGGKEGLYCKDCLQIAWAPRLVRGEAPKQSPNDHFSKLQLSLAGQRIPESD